MMLLPTLLVGALLGPVGCPSPHTSPVVAPVVAQPSGPTLSDELERLEALLASQRPQDALDALTEIESRFGLDPRASALQLVRGRALLALGDRVQAEAAFAAVADDATTGDVGTAGTARLYRALLAADAGRVDEGIGMLRVADAPGPLTGPGEAARLWTLAAERRVRDGDRVGALSASAMAFEASRDDEAQAELNAYAVARAFTLAGQLTAEQRELSFLELPPLARAAVGFELVLERRAAGDLEGAEAALLETAAALVGCEQTARLTELERIAQPNDGSKRLVGAVLPMTGESRRVGRTVLAGILQAQGAFFPGGGMRLTIVFKDSASDPAIAAQAVRELHALGALAVIGPLGIDETTAAAAVADELGLPLISLAPDPAARTGQSFRFGLDLNEETTEIARAAYAAGLRRVLVIRPETPFGRDAAATFGAELEALGSEVVGELTYEPGAPDLGKLAEAAAKQEMDGVFVPDTGEGATRVASFLAQQNIWSHAPDHVPGAKDKRRFVVFLGTGTWYGLDGQQGARYLDGALFSSSYARELSTSSNMAFVETFRRLYGREPGAYEAVAYDATRLVRDLVMTRGLRDRATLRAALLSPEPHPGVTGDLVFSDRNASPKPVLLQVRGTGLQIVERADAAGDEPAPGVDDAETPPDIDAILATPPRSSEP